jgi:transposase-like protein
MKWKRSPSTYPTDKALKEYHCPECKSHNWRYSGFDKFKNHRMVCKNCGRTFDKRMLP